MALRDKLTERVQPLLEPGEQVHEVWWGQTGPNPSFVLLTWLILFFSRYWICASTSQGVVVCKVKGQRWLQPESIAQRLPKGTHIGPLTGSLWSGASVTIDGNPLWIARRFYADVERADAAA
jgi:hypothetical protein